MLRLFEGRTMGGPCGDAPSQGATALVGMDGFVVGAQVEVDGELLLMVDATADVVGCDGCGTRAVGDHGRPRADLPPAHAPGPSH